MNTKTVSGLAMLAVAATPFAASAQSMAELIAKNPSLAAILAPYMAQSTSTASCAGTITKSLKKGMTDAEVATLQKMLNASADTAVATSGTGSKGMESSYFGAATKAAVIKFQNKYASEVLTPNGLTVGTGSVGAATRAKLNALCAATPATTTTSGNTTTTTTTTGTTTGLQGTAGSANLSQTSVDTDNTVKQGSSAKVAGFKIEAQDSDINVSNIKVTLKQGVNAGSDRLTRYASKVHVLMNGTEVGSADVADFTRNSDTTYTRSIALSNAVVRKGSGSKATFHIVVDALSALDSTDAAVNSWTVTADTVRYNDATGVTLSTSNGVTTTFAFQKLATSGDVKLTLSTGTNNPVAQNVKISETEQTKAVVLNEFKVKAEGSPLTFSNVLVHIDTTGDSSSTIGNIGNTLYIMKGSTQLGSVDISGATTTKSADFTVKLDSDYTVAKDNTDTFQATVDLNKQKVSNAAVYGLGATMAAKVLNTSFGSLTDTNGDKVQGSALNGSSIGNTMALYTKGIMASGFSTAITSVSNGQKASGQSYAISYHVKAFGGTYYIPKTSAALTTTILKGGVAEGATDAVASLGSMTSAANTVTINIAGTPTDFFEVADGADVVFNTNITLNPSATAGAGAGMYSIQLNTANFSDVNGTAQTAYTFAPVSSFKTAEAYVGAN